MTDGRKRIASAIAALGITALGGSMLVAGPTSAEPNISDVQARVDHLYHQAEQASERYNDVKLHLNHSQAALTSLRHDLARQQAKVDQIRKQVAASVVSQYQGQALSSTSKVFLSQNPDAFLSQLTTVSAYNDQQSQMMASFATQAKKLQMRKQAAKQEVARIAAAKRTLAAKKAEIHKKAGAAKDLLASLKADRRARIAKQQAAQQAAQQRAAPTPSRSAPRAPIGNVPVSGRAGAAVQYALAQVGDSYVYGATGPGSYDCSGLTMAAWGAAGVGLPHSSSAQMGSGTPVSSSQLQPGDLVFYYSPVHHVGIYIGNGQIVHAGNPSTGVQVAGVYSMPFSGAVRPG